jgi:6-phosphogluconolactonase
MTIQPPVIEIFPDLDALVAAAADRIVALLGKVLAEKPTAALALTGGKTPAPIYQLLATNAYQNRIDWTNLHFFWGDERCVPPDSPDSNYGMAHGAMLSKIDLQPDHVHRIRGEEEPSQAAELYEQEIIKYFSGTPVPSFDLTLLGMGEDGHTASLFPGVEWDAEKYVVHTQMPKTQSYRISLTPKLLNASSHIVFIVSGSNKAAALASVLEDQTCNLPAARIHAARGSVLWIMDSAAASLLTGK